MFLRAALCYWLTVFPRVSLQLLRLRGRARRIPDPALRRLALEALSKRSNIEGAAAFAAFVPWRHRSAATRALGGFQSVYNYTDLLAEQPSVDPVADARELHQALLVALDPRAEMPEHPAYRPERDGGYMSAAIADCRSALAELPSYAMVAAAAKTAAARIVSFQSLSLGEPGALERWARSLSNGEDELESWELAGAAGSSLALHALIAASAARSPRGEELAEIEAAYFPWIGALHSLLDSLVDEAEDAASGQLSLVGRYPSRQVAEERLRVLAILARDAARGLRDGPRHELMVTAMACNYLSARDAPPAARVAMRGVRESIGPLARLVLLVFRMREGGRGADAEAA